MALRVIAPQPGEERIFGWHELDDAVAWADAGGIAHHRNFDVDGLEIGGRMRSGPAFHTLGELDTLLAWGRKHRFPRSWVQPSSGRFPPHFDVFGALARQLVAKAIREGVDLA